MSPALGLPRRHHRMIGSTNVLAARLAADGAPHGTLVTAESQTAGRGRQGRSWHAPPGQALLMSLVLRHPPALLALASAVAVAEVAGPAATIKWPNDVLLDGRKVAGILVQGRPQEHWAVLGIGLNVAVELADLPEELRANAGTLGCGRRAIEPTLAALLAALALWLEAPAARVRAAWAERDALVGKLVRWNDGEGRAVGVDAEGHLLVESATGKLVALESGEVHLAA